MAYVEVSMRQLSNAVDQASAEDYVVSQVHEDLWGLRPQGSVQLFRMKYLKQREEFCRVAIDTGMYTCEQIDKAFPLGHSLPPGKLQTWLGRLLRMPATFSDQKRYINRFKLGADPEFVFLQRNREEGYAGRKDARGFNLKQGPAFGADNNGRLAEIRPYPSRSSVEVCASILATLRWMVAARPETSKYEWHAGAFIQDDGLGGHVHFGRKRPGRALEVAALDSLEETLLDLNVFSKAEALRRRQGDARHQIYGALGDYRLQAHGYEYRTFPSWLDSPELAFFTLTLSKLTVHEPNLVWRYIKATPEINLQKIRNFLSFYKTKDDDARLALVLLKRMLPMHRGGDFRARWGIMPNFVANPFTPKAGFIPSAIKPSMQDINEMFLYLLGEGGLPWRIPTPTWSPSSPPEGYYMVLDNVDTLQQKGLGELILDICASHERPLVIAGGLRDARKQAVTIPERLAQQLPVEVARLYGQHRHDNQTIFLDPESRTHRVSEVRTLLTSGALPLWRVKDCKRDSYQQWSSHAVKSPPKKRQQWVGHFIVEPVGMGPLPGN